MKISVNFNLEYFMNFKSIISKLLFSATFFLIFTFKADALSSHQIEHTKKIQNFIQTMVNTYNFKESFIIKVLKKAEINADILSKIFKPYEQKPWEEYQKYFLNEARINKGVNLWYEKYFFLKNIEKIYGVPSSIILAIWGIETFYGQKTGSFRVLDALTTLAFYYPPREKYFLSELENYLLLCRELNLEPNEIYGSYAGAIGQPQFMPSSYRQYGINDENESNRKVDLIHNDKDTLESIANYLNKHGWEKNRPIALQIHLDKKDFSDHKLKDLNEYENETKTIKQWRKLGLFIKSNIKDDDNAQLLFFKNTQQKDYWLVFHNFNVIKTYNTSQSYAMAVYLLSQKLKYEFNN